MANSRVPPWLWLILVPVALLILAIPGMWVFMRATAPVLHPSSSDVPSVTQSAGPNTAGAVDRARRIVRAHLAEENLPGMSIAVGIGCAVLLRS